MRAHATLVLACCAAAVGASFSLGGCAQEMYPKRLWDSKFTDASPAAVSTCEQTRATSYPARLAAMSAGSGSSAGSVVVVDTLFQSFVEVCGNCHGPGVAGLGGFSITSSLQFQTGFGQHQLNHVLSDAPAADPPNDDDPMPPYNSPNGMPFSKRADTDPVKQFATLVQEWITLGMPPSFTLGGSDGGAQDGGSSASSRAYSMSADVGNAMTNLANCIPSAGLVNSAPPDPRDAQLDAMFASLQAAQPGSGATAAQVIGLPEELSQTDLTTFDAAELATHRVFAFAPGYPLWSENAGKIRFVRVPIGTSIEFDKTNQTFTIPPNTRFYKTFMKQIADTDGSLRWRKIETRLILSRPDHPGVKGDNAPTALFGTYKWRDDESEADLVETPLRNGEPFADTVIQYNTDEQLAADILSANPAAPEQALIDGHAARHYAIPGVDRCHDCHMGSATQSFVLGFLPVQIKRRIDGGGGYYEPTGPDEATQLQRFIDYGLITGMTSPDDVLPLEQMEGSRTPRNEHELMAQAYMLGNCSHCHNPRGRPTIDSPVLECKLNFLPGPESGVFQFPLERTSPRIFRGRTGTTPLPYITPSLMDQPRYDQDNIKTLVQGAFGVATAGANGFIGNLVYAPWRALIYRNVDNGFAYVDDDALFPHMPMHTAGYDPRAKQILGDWMVSIPAALKHPELNEYETVDSPNSTVLAGCSRPSPPCPIDTSPQPYVEVVPGQPGYAAAVQAAAARLQILHTGYNPALPPQTTPFSRYADPLDTSDILDPDSLRDPICHPVPTATESPTPGVTLPPPGHPHWASTDLTSPPGNYAPRRPDWAGVLITNKADTASTAQGCGDSVSSQLSAAADEAFAIDLVQTLHIGLDPESTATPASTGNTSGYAGGSAGDAVFATFATTPIPFGLWQKKDGCVFPPSIHPVSYYTGDNRPRWMDNVPNLSPDAPVYEETPGAAVFKMICINCHGPLADSSGRLVDNLATMTGGNARVADFRDGFMGPVGSTLATSDRELAFGAGALPDGAPSNWINASTDDRAARYMSWMALGGTKAIIPPEILSIVSLTQVLGVPRAQVKTGQLSANMLSTAKVLCQQLFGGEDQEVFNPDQGVASLVDLMPAFINQNGDAQTWFRLCTMNHPSPVHVIAVGWDSTHMHPDHLYVPAASDTMGLALTSPMLLDPTSFPAGQPVGNVAGTTDMDGLHPDNLWPWCVGPTLANEGTNVAPATAYAQAHNWPICPTGVSTWAVPDAQRWAVRGAMNAGISVFLYVHNLEAKSAPDPDYNQCELLPGSTAMSAGTCGP
jgi:mono/diheme cytochrome c family protein